MMTYPHLRGRRCVLDLRCSTPPQAENSLPDQSDVAHKFIAANGLTIVRTIEQAGVTGSVPAAREDFEQILEWKRQYDDFDVVVVADISRFTRVGIKHGMKWEYDLGAAGIEVAFAAHDLPAGEDGDLIKPAYYFAAKMYVKSLAFNCARGSMSALLSERMAHCSRPPFGMDFLYLVDGKPGHIIRFLPDGSQLNLSVDAMGKKPKPEQILGTFPPNAGRGRNNHYRKQRNESNVLVPGDPDASAAVAFMFALKLINVWAGQRIAGELNRMGIAASRGGLWSIGSVDYILRNKSYVGVGIANMKTQAIFNMRAQHSPKVRNIPLRQLAQHKHQPLEIRPRDEWVERPYKGLEGFLGEDLRPLAEKFINGHLDRLAKGRKANPLPKNRHIDSEYILTNLLCIKQGGVPMSGFVSYSGGKKYRRYRVSKAAHCPLPGSILNQKVPAEPLERAVLAALQQVLTQVPEMRARIVQAVEKELKGRLKDSSKREELQAERKRVEGEYRMLIRDLGKHGREIAKPQIARLEAQLDSLDDASTHR